MCGQKKGAKARGDNLNVIISRRMLRAFCAILILILAGCTSQGPRSRYLEQIAPQTQTNLLAYRSGTNLQIRIPLRGKDAFAHASWDPRLPDATNYAHRFAVLDFDEKKYIARRFMRSRANRITVHSVLEWEQLVQKVLASLMPAQPNHAVLLLLQNAEVACFHDKAGKLHVIKLESKPPDVVMDRTCDDADFTRAAVQILKSASNYVDRRQDQFLFVTGEDPAFVLIDSKEQLIVFLNYPADPETGPVPVGFAVRALNSLLIRSLVVTAIKNPFTLILRGFWHLGTSGAVALDRTPESFPGPPPPLAVAPPMDLDQWERELDHMVSARRHKGQVDLLIDGEKFFPAFIESVLSAKRSVDIIVFIFDTDDYAVKIADFLRERSYDIKVRVLLDDLGSIFAAQVTPDSPMPPGFEKPASIKSYLRTDSHVHVRVSANPWLTVDHRKFMIIDGREAYLGGMNIGRSYRYDWHDLMVRLTGPIVGRLERDYRLAWAHAGPLGDFAYAWVWLFDHTLPRRNLVPNPIDLRPLGTATGKMEIYLAQFEAIEHARSYIYIENPYFDDDSCMRALIRARRRGVDVRLIFPSRNDSGLMQANNARVAGELVRNGVRVYGYPGMTHVKAAIYDGWACLGSANFDKMSLRVGQEEDVAFSDRDTVGKLKKELFETDFARSHEITNPVETTWFDSVVKVFIQQL
jgi:cardiolipin synthase A/B